MSRSTAISRVKTKRKAKKTKSFKLTSKHVSAAASIIKVGADIAGNFKQAQPYARLAAGIATVISALTPGSSETELLSKLAIAHRRCQMNAGEARDEHWEQWSNTRDSIIELILEKHHL